MAPKGMGLDTVVEIPNVLSVAQTNLSLPVSDYFIFVSSLNTAYSNFFFFFTILRLVLFGRDLHQCDVSKLFTLIKNNPKLVI